MKHDDVIKWKHFRVTGHLCGEFTVAGNSPVPVNSTHKGQWCGALMFSLICAWINGWVNNGEAGDLRRHRAHYDVTVMRAIHKWRDVVNYALIMLKKKPDSFGIVTSICGTRDTIYQVSYQWCHKSHCGQSGVACISLLGLQWGTWQNISKELFHTTDDIGLHLFWAQPRWHHVP